MIRNCLDCVELTPITKQSEEELRFSCELGAFGPTSDVTGLQHGLSLDYVPKDYPYYRCPLNDIK